MTATYTYSDELVSDLYKSAYGTRPTAHFWGCWKEMSPVMKQVEWNFLLQRSEDAADHERKREQEAIVKFEYWLRKVEDRHGTVENALRLMTESERDSGWMAHSQDAEHWVWKQGFLFTDRGREVVEMLKRIYKMEY
ncbi:MAG: hypothetical protein ACO20M_06005 [Methylophilaceae bacterium]